jgi:mono/diheme cytochrome c family protein
VNRYRWKTKEGVMKTLLGLVLAAVVVLTAACDFNLKSTRRFRLPQGNADNGKAAFVALNCTTCHTVAGVDLPKPTVEPTAVVVLGGEVARLRTYGDLLTSIIHPTHSLSEKMNPMAVTARGTSPMPVVNDRMTVTQMVDLVTFLQPRYRQLPPPVEWYYPL